MTNEEFLMIKRIIDEDIDSGKISGLEEIKKYINFKLYDSNEVNFEDKKAILKQTFLKFISNNMTESKIQSYSIKDINKAISKIRKISESSVRVYDIIGIDIVALLKEKNVSVTGVVSVEQLLNTYGLSIYHKIGMDLKSEFIESSIPKRDKLKEEYDELVNKIAQLRYKQQSVPKSYYNSLKRLQEQILQEDIRNNIFRLKL